MHYYQHHIGDYLKDTAHLSLIEDAIYRRLLDYYYLHEKPLPESVQSVARMIRANDHVQQVEIILAEFFEKTAKGWEQKRCNLEIREYGLICEKNRENGKKGGRPKKTQLDTERLDLANPDVTQTKANHEPLTIITDTNVSVVSSKPADSCPHDEIRLLYAELLPSCTQPKIWNGTRQQNLRSRWREDKKRQTLDYWKRLFNYISQSDFLMGKVSGSNGKAFQLGLDWIVKAENFNKIIEGKYHHD